VIRPFDCPDLEQEHRLILTAADELSATEASVILSRLEEFARAKDTLDYQDRRAAFAYVVAAERMGLLLSDDFNGFLVIKIVGGTLVNDMGSHLDCPLETSIGTLH
jgi:hypothetical protein